jgi:hypothetical protein
MEDSEDIDTIAEALENLKPSFCLVNLLISVAEAEHGDYEIDPKEIIKYPCKANPGPSHSFCRAHRNVKEKDRGPNFNKLDYKKMAPLQKLIKYSMLPEFKFLLDDRQSKVQ